MHIFPLPKHPSSPGALGQIYHACWDLLEASPAMPDGGWRLPVLATQSREGCRVRTVVLRAVRQRSSLLFHTDIRSEKIRHIKANPQVSLLFYSHPLAVQLQISGVASIHHSDEYADQLWMEGSPANLKMYLAPKAPGTSCLFPDSNLPKNMTDRIPDRTEIEAGRTHFAVIQVQADTAEWLLLSREGNLRAKFEIRNGQLADSEWLTP